MFHKSFYRIRNIILILTARPHNLLTNCIYVIITNKLKRSQLVKYLCVNDK